MAEDTQLTFEDDPVYRQYQDTFLLVRQSEFSKAYEALDQILQQKVNLPAIYAVMKCLKFWINREKRIEQSPEGEKKAEYLQEQWSSFEDFVTSRSLRAGKIILILKEVIFTKVIDNHIYEFQKSETSDSGLLIKIAECFLAIEKYKKAKDTLVYARRFKKRDPRLLAYLAECYYFLGEISKALALYKEAFFIRPQEIPLESLKSEIILQLTKKVSDHGFFGKEVNLWLPVYAEVENVFSVKKKLRKKEVEAIQKQIYKYEIQYEINPKRRGAIEPRLINHYINLIDQLSILSQEEDKLQIKNILRKLKNLNEAVYLKLRKYYE